ncbi:CBM containing tail protein [Lactobacillus phage Lbab1]|nr:CBM containing tail protein [Lactobacillus phage Lbab1]
MELKGKSSRIQSSLGSKLVSSSDSVVSTLLIARVTDINYKENYVIFVPITTNNTSRPATRGTNQAILPSEFAGRNGFGRPYGVINPIHVGDIVLIGLLESDAAKPIVISRYPDTKIATELTNQVAEHYEPADFTTYADANRMTVVYPDQGYNIHDGRGNLTLKFSGNTFMLVRPDIPNVSHSTDDGQSPISAQDIPGNKDGLGQDRNSLVQNAPEVIYGHRGNINKDGTKDNHAYYVYIGQDGDYRVSMMQDDQDWRTYFEETPDGQIRLRRQEDSKIFGTGSKSSEFLIDNNGYVTIRSQSTGLVLKPDGIYNLDGTKFTVDTDLSGVWDAITKTQNGVKENKAQITVNANEIATKVSTDELPAAINNQLKPYDDSLKSLQDSYTDVKKTIDNMASDGIISGADKKATRTIWLQIQTEYPATVAQAEANSVDHSSLDTSYNTLLAYLEPILNAGGDTTVDPTEWDRNFSNYYNASFNVNTAIVATLRKLAQDGYDKAVQAGLDAGSAITQVSEASSEDYLTGSDKATLNHIWVQIQNQYPNDVDSANAVSVDHSALDSAYNVLSNYITSNNIFADNSTIAISGSDLANKIKAYFDQESAVLKQVADKNIQTLAQYGEDINHQATAIKETSDKIALSAENIQKQGNSLSVMQGQLNVMSNQISGGVSETDVTGIVNDSLSGTDLGSTNQFVLATATKGQYMNGNNGSSSASTNGIISDYIPVKASTSYTGKAYGATGTTKLSIAWYDTSKTFISGTEVSGTGDFTNSGSSPSNAAYAKVSMDNYNVNTLFIAGDAPDIWSPSYADAKSNVADANTLLKSLTTTQAIIASNINANTNKSKANVSNIDNMFVAGNLGSTDIGTLKAILADTETDNTNDNSLATQYGVDISALNNYYSQLQTDINGIISQDEGTTVDVDSYKAKLSAYYNSRDTFLKAVKGKIDSQVSSAQESLTNANNTVQEVITNKYANFAVTVDGISMRVGEVSEKADNASEAASTAQSSADDAKNRAISAASAAATAQASATTANSAASAAASAASSAQVSANATQSSLDALTNDGNISPIEKQTLAKEYATIKSNKAIDLAQATKYSVSSTSYTNAETAVETLVDPILADMTTSTSVDRDSYKSTFSTYYDARTNLLNAIADVAKNAASAAASAASVAQGTANSAASAASAAQSDLNRFKTTTTQKFSEISQTADEIKQSVTDVTTTANNANNKINNLQVGGTNLYTDTRDFDNPNAWINWPSWYKTGEKFNGLTVMGTKNDWNGLGQTIQAKKGETYTFSLYARYESGTGKSSIYFPASSGKTDPMFMQVSLNETWQRFTGTFTVTADGPIQPRIERTPDNTNTLLIDGLKLEVGNTATAWSPAPADNASASDLAATNQTVKTVQTQTANNWSIFAQGIGGTSAGISVDGSGTVTISGNKLVIGSDFIAGNITGKTITGSTFGNTSGTFKIDADGNIKGASLLSPNISVPFSHMKVSGSDIQSSGTLSLSGPSYTIDGNVEGTTGTPNGQQYHTELNPSGLFSYITTTDGKTILNSTGLHLGTLELSKLIDGSGTSARYTSTFADADTLYQANKIGTQIWQGGFYPSASDHVLTNITLSNSLTGWMIAWSFYQNGTIMNNNWAYTLIPKVALKKSSNYLRVTFTMQNVGTISKLLWYDDNHIIGDDSNKTGNAASAVMTDVFAY